MVGGSCRGCRVVIAARLLLDGCGTCGPEIIVLLQLVQWLLVELVLAAALVFLGWWCTLSIAIITVVVVVFVKVKREPFSAADCDFGLLLYCCFGLLWNFRLVPWDYSFVVSAALAWLLSCCFGLFCLFRLVFFNFSFCCCFGPLALASFWPSSLKLLSALACFESSASCAAIMWDIFSCCCFCFGSDDSSAALALAYFWAFFLAALAPSNSSSFSSASESFGLLLAWCFFCFFFHAMGFRVADADVCLLLLLTLGLMMKSSEFLEPSTPIQQHTILGFVLVRRRTLQDEEIAESCSSYCPPEHLHWPTFSYAFTIFHCSDVIMTYAWVTIAKVWLMVNSKNLVLLLFISAFVLPWLVCCKTCLLLSAVLGLDLSAEIRRQDWRVAVLNCYIKSFFFMKKGKLRIKRDGGMGEIKNYI